MAFMLRSSIISSKEYAAINLDQVEQKCKEFYILYEQLFGAYNCTYNTHIVGSHWLEMRIHGPLTLTSAFGFESFYGEMRNAFTPGTQNTLKQIFQKILLKRALNYHCCENTIYFSEKDTPMECNSLVYTYEHNEHKMYKIFKVEEDHLLCYTQGKYSCNFREVDDVNWSTIGVYRRGGVSSTPKIILKSDVWGKVIKVDDFLITCPNEILREK